MLLLVLGMLSAFFTKIPNLGFGTTTPFETAKMPFHFTAKMLSLTLSFFRRFIENDPINIVVLAALTMIIVIFQNDGADDDDEEIQLDSHNVFQQRGSIDWLEKIGRGGLSALYTHFSNWGNGKHVSPLKKSAGCLLMYAVPATSEEVFFRGFLQTLFSRHVGMKRAIAFQAVLFGMFHLSYKSKAYVLHTIGTGLVFGWLYAKTGSLLLSILLHFAWNSRASMVAIKILSTFLEYELQDLCRFRPTELFKGSNQKGNAAK